MQALGLEQRILASPRGRSLDHQSGRKAGNVRLRPHGALLQEPCLHAPEGRRGSHLFEQLRRREIIKAKRDLGIFFSSCARISTEVRQPQAENSVAALQLFNAQPGSLAISVDDIVEAAHPPAEMSVLALQLHTALSFAEELPIELRDEMPLVRALGLEQRVLAGPLALHVAGPSEQPRGRERPRPPTGFSRSHACTHRKAAEEVISLSMGSKSLRKRESEKTRKRELGIFLFFKLR